MSSAHSGFQLEAIFTSGFVLKSEIIFAGAVFPMSHFAWMLFSPVGFVHKVILYLWEQIFLFVTKAILIMPRKQLHSTYFLSLAATDAM